MARNLYGFLVFFLLFTGISNTYAQLLPCGPIAILPGCTDPCDSNYDILALCDDGSCNNDNGRCVCPTVLQPYANYNLDFCGGDILNFPNPVADGVVDNLDNATLAWLPTNGGLLGGSILINLTCTPNVYTYTVQATCWPALGFPSTVNLGTVTVTVYPDPITYAYTVVPAVPCVPFFTPTFEPSIIAGPCLTVNETLIPAIDGCSDNGDFVQDGSISYLLSSPNNLWPCGVNEALDVTIPACEQCPDCPTTAGDFGIITDICDVDDLLNVLPEALEVVLSLLSNPGQVYVATVTTEPDLSDPANWPVLAPGDCGPTDFNYDIVVGCTLDPSVHLVAGTIQVTLWDFNPANYGFTIEEGACGTLPVIVETGDCALGNQLGVVLELPVDGCPDDGDPVQDGLFVFEPTLPFQCIIETQIDFPPPITIPIPYCNTCPSDCPTSAGNFGTITDICTPEDVYYLLPNIIAVIASVANNPNSVLNSTVNIVPDIFDPTNWPNLAPGDCGPTVFSYDVIVGCTLDPSVELLAGTIELTAYDLNPANYGFEVVQGACGTLPVVVPSGPCALGEQIGIVLNAPVDGCPDDGDPVQDGLVQFDLTFPGDCWVQDQLPASFTTAIPYCNTCLISTNCTPISASIEHAGVFCEQTNNIIDLRNLESGTTNGEWSINGAVLNPPLLDISAAGTYSLGYSVLPPASDPVYCVPVAATQTIVVYAVPNAGSGNSATLCNNASDGPVLLTISDLLSSDADLTGFWQAVNGAPSLVIGNVFNADGLTPGIYEYTYTVGSLGAALGLDNPCAGAVATFSILVSDCSNTILCSPLDANLLDAPTLCASLGDSFDLNALIAGDANGTWLVNGTPSTNILPIDVADDYWITYTVNPPSTDPSSCSEALSSTLLVVTPLPDTNFTLLDTAYCSSDAPISLVAASSGGTFSGEGVSDAIFNPRFVTNFNTPLPISYSLTDAYGCNSSYTQYVTIYEELSAYFTPLNPTYWTHDEAILLVPSIAGGTFSGDCLLEYNFVPTLAEVGNSCTITYSLNNGACTNSISQTVTVYACTPPSGLSVDAITYDGASLSWTALANSNEYVLQYRPSDALSWETLTVTGTSISIGGLLPCTNYDIQLATWCGNTSSSYSTPVSFSSIGCGLTVAVKVLLEGAYDTNSSTMYTNLQQGGFLPLNQPYNNAPWYYLGNENITSANDLPNNIVDWVLVELRDGNDKSLVVAQQAVFLRHDGYLVSANWLNNGLSSGLLFDGLPDGNYYISLRHRNHIDVISATAVALPNLDNPYDFSIADTQSYGNKQQKQLSDGAYALFAGDINGDGIISYSDFNLYLAQTGSINTYNDSDINLDANTSTFDFNLYLPNASYIGVMEIRY